MTSDRQRDGAIQVVAVCGKGGVGKTTVSAMLARALAVGRRRRTLAVDADHAGGLAMALGIEPQTTLEAVRRAAVGEAKGEAASAERDLAAAVDYGLLEALGERGRLGFLAVGQPAGRGCYCRVNKLLRQAIATLARRFDATVIDAEAGVEHVNRDVVGAVDYLLLVSDTSRKGLRVAEAIVAARRDLGHDDAGLGLLVNRVTGGAAEAEAVAARCQVPLRGWLPEDEAIRRFDAEARSLLELDGGCAALAALEPTVAALWPPLP